MIAVFGTWLTNMDNFKKEYEIRRVIFGLSAIVSMDPATIPQMVQEKIRDIGLEFSKLSIRVDDVRRKILASNKKYVEKGGLDSDDEDEDFQEMEGDDFDGETAYEDMKKKIASFNDK
jgi:hypothetical protein